MKSYQSIFDVWNNRYTSKLSCMSLGVFSCLVFLWGCFWIPRHALFLSWPIYSLKFCVICFLFANMPSGLPTLRHYQQLWSWQTLAQTKYGKIRSNIGKRREEICERMIRIPYYVVGLFVKWMQKVMNEQVFVSIVGLQSGLKGKEHTHKWGGGNYNIHGVGCAS